MTIIISAAPARIALTGRAIIWALNSEVSWILALGVGLTFVSRYGDAGVIWNGLSGCDPQTSPVVVEAHVVERRLDPVSVVPTHVIGKLGLQPRRRPLALSKWYCR